MRVDISEQNIQNRLIPHKNTPMMVLMNEDASLQRERQARLESFDLRLDQDGIEIWVHQPAV
jgi:hypothetical protein